VLAREILPQAIPNSVRHALADLEVDPGPDGPTIDAWWGERGLTQAEKVFGWNTFEVLAMVTGNPDRPVNAVPPRAKVHCQIRFTIDKDPNGFLPALRKRLQAKGFGMVTVSEPSHTVMNATRLDPEHPVSKPDREDCEGRRGKRVRVERAQKRGQDVAADQPRSTPGGQELQPRQGQEPDEEAGEDPARHAVGLVGQAAHPVDDIAGRALEARTRVDLLTQPRAPAQRISAPETHSRLFVPA